MFTAGVADVTQEGPLGTWVVMYHSSEATKGAIKMLSTKGTRVLEKSIHLMIDDVDMDGSQPKVFISIYKYIFLFEFNSVF